VPGEPRVPVEKIEIGNRSLEAPGEVTFEPGD
jgi:hypothetical protein